MQLYDGARRCLQLAIECALAGNLFDAGAAAAVAGMASPPERFPRRARGMGDGQGDVAVPWWQWCVPFVLVVLGGQAIINVASSFM